MKILMDRNHYADSAGCDCPTTIISDKAKGILAETFSNSVDFADIEMVSQGDLTDLQIKERRDSQGSVFVKRISDNPPQYHRMLLKKGADIDFQKMNVILALDCPKCGRKDYVTPGSSYIRDGITYIAKATWNGLDIFYIEGLGVTIFCTERFVEVYNENNLTGLEFEQVPVV